MGLVGLHQHDRIGAFVTGGSHIAMFPAMSPEEGTGMVTAYEGSDPMNNEYKVIVGAWVRL